MCRRIPPTDNNPGSRDDDNAVRRLGYDPADLTVTDKLVAHVLRLRRWVILVSIAAVLGMALIAWLMGQQERYQLQISNGGFQGWLLDTRSGKIEGLTWKDGVIRP